MNILNEKKKEKAIELLEELEIYKPYINAFKKENRLCYFENNFAGFWVDENPELLDKVREFEEKRNCLVYAVTHEFTEVGELYDFLFVPDYEEYWEFLVEPYHEEYFAYSYTWNKSDEPCSEPGAIIVRKYGGGIRRVG